MPRVKHIKQWLASTVTASKATSYRHRILAENPDAWDAIKPELKRYFRQAHSDAVRRLRRLAGIDLRPARKKAPADPARNYPHGFDLTTLKGYFGELVTYLVAESFDACGHSDWEVPGYLFRFHLNAFQALEAQGQGGAAKRAMVGRTGDDCLAFRRDARSGDILAVLYCEAKCSATHDPALVNQAHEKLNGPGPLDILNLIEVLEDNPSPENNRWVEALRTFREGLVRGKMKRFDLACYLCGQPPARKTTWISTHKPHGTYTPAGRLLEAVEVHLAAVDEKVRAVYSEEGWV